MGQSQIFLYYVSYLTKQTPEFLGYPLRVLAFLLGPLWGWEYNPIFCLLYLRSGNTTLWGGEGWNSCQIGVGINPFLVKFCQYCREVIKNIESWLSEQGKQLPSKCQTPLSSAYRPETDVMVELIQGWEK